MSFKFQFLTSAKCQGFFSVTNRTANKFIVNYANFA